MASPRTKVALVATLLVVVACTSGEVSAESTTVEPFASTPTIGTTPDPSTTNAPTTTLLAWRAQLEPVEPLTLEPRFEVDPILMNDWFCCTATSPDGRFIAGITGGNIENEIRIIDVESWAELGAWTESRFDRMVDLNEVGTLFFLTSGGTFFRQLTLDSAESQVLAQLHPGFSSLGSGVDGEGRYVFFGTRTAGSDRALIQVVDTNTGRADAAVTSIDLPDLVVGPIDPESPLPGASSQPSFSVDPDSDRGFVVHGDEDVVSEVNLTTGTIVEHEFLAPASSQPASQGVWRASTISPDGRLLYVSSRVASVVGNEEEWTTTSSPAGVITIDTSAWEVVAHTEEPVADDLYLSPDGNRIIAGGYTTSQTGSTFDWESHGIALLDAVDLGVVDHYPPENPEENVTSISYSADGSVGYYTIWVGDRYHMNAIDTGEGRLLSTRSAGTPIEMIGPSAVLVTD